MTYILIISGKMGSGKDTIAQLLKKSISQSKTYAYADPVRDEIKAIIGIIGRTYISGSDTESTKNSASKQVAGWMSVSENEAEKITEILWDFVKKNYRTSSFNFTQHRRHHAIREAMQFWGTDVRRSKNPDYWVNKILKQISEDNPDVAIITDCRFPNESLQGHRSIVRIRLEVSPEEQLFRLIERDGGEFKEESLYHASEALDFEVDHTVDTTGLTPEQVFDKIVSSVQWEE